MVTAAQAYAASDRGVRLECPALNLTQDTTSEHCASDQVRGCARPARDFSDADCLHHGLKAFLPALGLLTFSLTWSLGLTLWPRPGQPVAAIFPPAQAGAPAFNAAAAAGADTVLSFGGFASVILAQSSRPDFPDRLYSQGALMVLRAPLSGGCMHQERHP